MDVLWNPQVMLWMWHSFSRGTHLVCRCYLKTRTPDTIIDPKHFYLHWCAIPNSIGSKYGRSIILCHTQTTHVQIYFAITPYISSMNRDKHSSLSTYGSAHGCCFSLLCSHFVIIVFTYITLQLYIHIYLTNFISGSLFFHFIPFVRTRFVSWLTSIWYYDFYWIKFDLNFSCWFLFYFFPIHWMIEWRVTNRKSFHYIMCKVVINLQILLSTHIHKILMETRRYSSSVRNWSFYKFKFSCIFFFSSMNLLYKIRIDFPIAMKKYVLKINGCLKCDLMPT